MKQVIVFGSLNMDLTIRCERMPQQGETVEGTNSLQSRREGRQSGGGGSKIWRTHKDDCVCWRRCVWQKTS